MAWLLSALNWIIVGVSTIALVWRIIVMLRPFPIEAKDTIRGVLTAPLSMVAYCLILGGRVISPLGYYLLGGGLVLGLLFGRLTRVRVEEAGAVGRRASLYLLLWAAVYLLTQYLGTAVGDGGVSAGVTLMVLPLAMGATQDLFMLARARAALGRAARSGRGAVAAGAAFGLVLLVLAGVLFTGAARAQRFPGEDWTDAAAIEYVKGNYKVAVDLARTAEGYFGAIYEGPAKARTQLVASMASEKLKAGSGQSWADKAQRTLEAYFGERGLTGSALTSAVSAETQSLRTQIQQTRPKTYALRTADVAFAPLVGACYRQDIPALWAKYQNLIERYRNYPGVGALLNSLLPVVQALGESKPLPAERVLVAGAAVPVILAGSTLLDMRAAAELARRRRELTMAAKATEPGRVAAETAKAALAPKEPAAIAKAAAGSDLAQATLSDLAQAASGLQARLGEAVAAGAELPFSVTEWRADSLSLLDVVRWATQKHMDYEDKIEAAKEVRELLDEWAEKRADVALSRLKAAVAYLLGHGSLGDDPWAGRLDELAAKIGPKGIRTVLAVVDNAGRDAAEAAKGFGEVVGRLVAAL